MWKQIKTNILFKHPRLTLVEDDVRLPSGKTIQYLRFDGMKDAAVVICFRNSQLLIQKEFSYPTNEALHQFPGGAIEQNESPVQAAQRELHEEANLLADDLRPLGSFYIDNRRSDAKMYVFLAIDPKEQNGKPDDEEDITSEWVSIADFKQKVQEGEIKNFSMLAAWSLFINSPDSVQAS
jgi:ADP-ribose pyrophosphatase